MIIIVGLGNIGKEYASTYHNTGFMTVACLAEKLGMRFKTKKCKAEIAEGNVNGNKVILALPQTYMNLSGESVRELLGSYKAAPANLIVVYDDIDIPLGDIRIREKGSAGTHNGMRSIIECIKTENFRRVRVGIGGKPEFVDIKDYVLSNVPKDKQDILRAAIEKAVEALQAILAGGLRG